MKIFVFFCLVALATEGLALNCRVCGGPAGRCNGVDDLGESTECDATQNVCEVIAFGNCKHKCILLYFTILNFDTFFSDYSKMQSHGNYWM